MINLEFKCKKCDAIFESHSKRSTHVERFHRVIIDSIQFKDDIRKSITHDIDELFKCSCEYIYTYPSNLRHHYRSEIYVTTFRISRDIIETSIITRKRHYLFSF